MDALLYSKPHWIMETFVWITVTSLCKAWKQPFPHHLLIPSLLGLKSANPSLVQQTAISVWIEHVACSGGCGCSNWYVWESMIEGGKDKKREIDCEKMSVSSKSGERFKIESRGIVGGSWGKRGRTRSHPNPTNLCSAQQPEAGAIKTREIGA